MLKHRFSVVVPTRDRADTLPFTLRTCLEQEFDDYEVVVSDNCSDPATRQVVEALAHPRLRYVRTPRPLAVSDSWDFAVAQAAGEYLTILGSDDGLLPHALREIDRLLRTVNTLALRWECVNYTWPNLPVTEHAQPNRLQVPLTQVGGAHALRRVEAGDVISAAANSQIPYSRLPMIYCSAIHHSLLTRLRERTGRVFRSLAPDMYSAFAFAHAAGAYHSVDAPMAINALSGRSTGVAVIYLQGRSPIGQEFHALSAGAGHALHPWVPDLPVMAAYIADAFLHARDALFPEDETLSLDRKLLAMNCLRQVRCADANEWRTALESVRQSLSDDPSLQAWLAEQDKAGVPTPQALTPPLLRYSDGALYLKADGFGVSDVYGAAQLCEQLLGYRADGLTVQVDPDDPVVRLQKVADERLELIHKLEATADERLRLIHTLDAAAAERLRVIQTLQAALDAPRLPRTEAALR